MTTHIDIHVLQTVPPSNLNRDEQGTPKTAWFGGVKRARVSSQAWKRATRRDFRQYLDEHDLGVRTVRAAQLLAERIVQQNPQTPADAAMTLATKALEAAGLKTVKSRRKVADGDEVPGQTEYLVFLSNRQLDRLAELAIGSGEKAPTKKEALAALDADHSIDVALFGRMVANASDLNVDAACQVAHAISTHGIQVESDFYTAVDDLQSDDESGAGMIGTIEFDSATLYRYATLSVDTLFEHLLDAEATTRAVEAFIRSFSLSMPTGKQNTFANRTVPDAVVVAIRDDRPVSLVGAFEDAIRSVEGFVRPSSEALVRHAKEVQAFAAAPRRVLVTRSGTDTDALSSWGEQVPFDALVAAAGQAARAQAEKP